MSPLDKNQALRSIAANVNAGRKALHDAHDKLADIITAGDFVSEMRFARNELHYIQEQWETIVVNGRINPKVADDTISLLVGRAEACREACIKMLGIADFVVTNMPRHDAVTHEQPGDLADVSFETFDDDSDHPLDGFDNHVSTGGKFRDAFGLGRREARHAPQVPSAPKQKDTGSGTRRFHLS